jgi:hypothetical protein
LVTVAPNLGTGDGDLKALIASIEAVGVKPAVIALDTLSQSLGGADENNTGMASFMTNSTALANHFQCFVPNVHHVSLSDDKRLRGNTTLIGGLDVADPHGARGRRPGGRPDDQETQGRRRRDAVKGAINREVLMACNRDGVRYLWIK